MGARIGEVAGLRLQDIHVSGSQVPHVVIASHPARRLKTPVSARKVPLVGAALWAAQRIYATASPGQALAFPRYLRGSSISGDAASATVNKWLALKGFSCTSHGFRHTMKDRLRNANVPKPLQDEILGHSRSSGGEDYGEGTMLERLQEALERSLHTARGG